MNSPMSNPGQVKSFPSEDELAQLQRRLTFHPSTVTDPKVLAQAQVAAYNCEGYIKPIKRVDLFGKISDAGDIEAGEQNNVGGLIDRREGSFVEACGGVDDDIRKVACQHLQHLTAQLLGHQFALLG